MEFVDGKDMSRQTERQMNLSFPQANGSSSGRVFGMLPYDTDRLCSKIKRRNTKSYHGYNLMTKKPWSHQRRSVI